MIVEPVDLDPCEREILEHSLTGGSKRVYRNHFAADLTTGDGVLCLKLTDKGFMWRNPRPGTNGLVYFHVTKAGAEAVGLQLEQDCHE